MKWYCDRCCIEYETSDLIAGCICPNCDSNLQYKQNHDTLKNPAIDTISKYDNLQNFVSNEVYPYIQGLYYPKYTQYYIDKIKIIYSGNFVVKPKFKFKLIHTANQYKHKHFEFFVEILDMDWKEELKKEFNSKIERTKQQIEQKIKTGEEIKKEESISSRILSYKIMNNLIDNFHNKPLTEEEQKYLKYQKEIPNDATIEAIKELERMEK